MKISPFRTICTVALFFLFVGCAHTRTRNTYARAPRGGAQTLNPFIRYSADGTAFYEPDGDETPCGLPSASVSDTSTSPESTSQSAYVSPNYASAGSYVPRSAGSSAGRYYDYNYRPAVGDHYVASYVRRDGTFVEGHNQTNRDDSFWNNWSSSGNVNPYTGRVGSRSPPIGSYRSYGGSSYVSGYTTRSGTYVSSHYRRSR